MSFSYISNLENKARNLHTKQTDTERFLWAKLRGKQLAGYKFYRQYPIGNYIVDFYCSERKLVIELDGSQHQQQIAYDENRSKYLHDQGLTVARFWDNEVLQQTDAVLEKILDYLTS